MPKNSVLKLAKRKGDIANPQQDTKKATNGLNQEGAKFPPQIAVFNLSKASSFSPS